MQNWPLEIILQRGPIIVLATFGVPKGKEKFHGGGPWGKIFIIGPRCRTFSHGQFYTSWTHVVEMDFKGF